MLTKNKFIFSLYVLYIKVMPALSDKQKKDLAKHIEKKGGSPTERRSHRMKMISRMSRGMSIKQAHADINKKGSSAKPKVKKPTGFERKNRGKGKYSMSNPIDGGLLQDATHALYGGFNASFDLRQSNHRDEDEAKSYLSRQPHGKRGLIFKTMDLTSPAVITVVPDRDAPLSKDDIFDKARELDRSGRVTGRPNFIVVQN
jgi:hypothetical protein